MNRVLTPVNTEDRQKLDFRAGDTVRVQQKIQEKGKTRLQAFEGIVLARKHGTEAGATFTVRRVASGVGVEKIFPLYSPNIDNIEVLKRSKVRRSKLYHIREKAAKDIRRQMRNIRLAKDNPEKALPESTDVDSKEQAETPIEEEITETEVEETNTPEESTVEESVEEK